MRGRPKTRNRLSFQWHVWRLVRWEYLKSDCKTVSEACERILEKAGGKMDFVSECGGSVCRIQEAVTLKQWFSEAEAERNKPESELGVRCAAWEAHALRNWPDVVGRAAYWNAVRDMPMRGVPLNLDNYVSVNEIGCAAAAAAKEKAVEPAAPRKYKKVRKPG